MLNTRKVLLSIIRSYKSAWCIFFFFFTLAILSSLFQGACMSMVHWILRVVGKTGSVKNQKTFNEYFIGKITFFHFCPVVKINHVLCWQFIVESLWENQPTFSLSNICVASSIMPFSCYYYFFFFSMTPEISQEPSVDWIVQNFLFTLDKTIHHVC